MISGFVSRSFGVGLYLSETELNEVDERRMGSEWGHYVSTREAMTFMEQQKKENY